MFVLETKPVPTSPPPQMFRSGNETERVEEEEKKKEKEKKKKEKKEKEWERELVKEKVGNIENEIDLRKSSGEGKKEREKKG